MAHSGSVIQGCFPRGSPHFEGRPAAGAIQPKVGRPQWVQAAVGGHNPASPRAVAQPRVAPLPARVATPFAQRLPNGTAVQLPPHLAKLSGAPGQPFPQVVQRKMEAFFQTSFADVRVHVGPQAQAIGALAFTHGSNLYFAPGQYNPDTAQGRQLIGRELTHVVQQRAGRVRNPFGSGIAVVHERAMEAEAERRGMGAAAHFGAIQPKMRASVAQRRVRPSVVQCVGIVDVDFSKGTHEAALLEAKVQTTTTCYHVNRDNILPKGLQSPNWSPYIELNLPAKYNLGARAIYDVEDRKVFLAGHYDDGGDYELLKGVSAEVFTYLNRIVARQLANECTGSKLQHVADWTVQSGEDPGLLIRSMGANFKKHGETCPT